MTQLEVVNKAITTLTSVKESLESGNQENDIKAIIGIVDSETFTSAVIGDEISTISSIIGIASTLSNDAIDALAKFLSNKDARKDFIKPEK